MILLKHFKKYFAGYLFSTGAYLIVLLIATLQYTHFNSFLYIYIVASSAGCSGYYFGNQWGKLILSLNSSKQSALKSTVYGMIVGIYTLYTTLLIVLFISYFEMHFMRSLAKRDYLEITTDLFITPFLSLFASIIAFFSQPLIPLSSGLCGLLVYFLRRKIYTVPAMP